MWSKIIGIYFHSLRNDLPSKDIIDTGAGGDVNTQERAVTPPPPPADGDVEAGIEQSEAAVPDTSSYNIEFTFDSDVTCNITVMYFAKEDMVNGGVV